LKFDVEEAAKSVVKSAWKTMVLFSGGRKLGGKLCKPVLKTGFF